MRNTLLRIMLVFAVASVVSCTRGETKSLTEVFDTAKHQYQSQNVKDLAPEVSTVLASVNGGLDNLVSASSAGQNPAATDINKQGEQVADALLSIVNKCGFTVRPAMGELISQYRSLGSSGSVNAGGVKLLVSRTYQLLSSELETTRFKL
jgi:hypothetical protein